MTNLDDRLRAGLGDDRAAAPDLDRVAADVRRRRARRTVVRKAQTGALAVVVLAGSIGGFLALRAAFDTGTTEPARTPAGNGAVAFVRNVDVTDQLFVAPSDGARGIAFDGAVQVTAGDEDVRDPAWSPDGHAIAFVQIRDNGDRRIAIYDLATGTVESVTQWWAGLASPSWSPDGERLAFVGWEMSGGDPMRFGVWLVDTAGVTETRIAGDGLREIAAPIWSPDGDTIAFSASLQQDPSTWDLYLTPADPDGTPTKLTNTLGPGSLEVPIGWLANGHVLAAVSPADMGPYGATYVSTSTWVEVAPDGATTTSAFDAGRAQLIGTAVPDDALLRLSPDANAVLVSPAVRQPGTSFWIVDAAGGATELASGAASSGDWQPVLASNPPPDVVAVEIPPEWVDIGLGIKLCQDARLGGLDLVPGGDPDVAWTGFLANDEGMCPQDTRRQRWVVAVDVTGDGVADASTDLTFLVNCPYVWCWPLGTTDLDADGDGELIVTTGFSIRDQGYLSIVATDTGYAIEPILVAEPGHPAAGITPGDPLTTSVDGDEGYAAWIRCEGFPDAPVLVFTWVHSDIQEKQDSEWHEVKLELQDDGMFHVIDATDLSLPPSGDDPGFIRSNGPACGIAFSQSA